MKVQIYLHNGVPFLTSEHISSASANKQPSEMAFSSLPLLWSAAWLLFSLKIISHYAFYRANGFPLTESASFVESILAVIVGSDMFVGASSLAYLSSIGSSS
jgi:hypothetical protein